LTARHVAALDRAADLRVVGVMTAFDPDAAGLRAAVRGYHLLVPVTEQLSAVEAPGGRDPAKMLEVYGPAVLARTLATRGHPLADLVVDDAWSFWKPRLHQPEGQIGALREAAPVIAAMPNGYRARQVRRLAASLRLDYPTVTGAVADAVTGVVTESPASLAAATVTNRGDAAGRSSADMTAGQHPARPQRAPAAAGPPLDSRAPRNPAPADGAHGASARDHAATSPLRAEGSRTAVRERDREAGNLASPNQAAPGLPASCSADATQVSRMSARIAARRSGIRHQPHHMPGPAKHGPDSS
jgi:DNA primase